MDFSASLSPELYTFLSSASADFVGGLAASFATGVLNYGARRLREEMASPPNQQALERAAGAAIAQSVAEWQIVCDDYTDQWRKFGAWLLQPVVLSEFRVLIASTDASLLDVELLREEFAAAGLDIARLSQPDFDALLQDIVGGFYAYAAEEPLLQVPLQIGLLRRLADEMGALERLASSQTQLSRRGLGQLERLNLLADRAADDDKARNELLQDILLVLQDRPTEFLPAQQLYAGVLDALNRVSITSLDAPQSPQLSRIAELLEELLGQVRRQEKALTSDELALLERRYRQSLIDQFERLTFRGISPSARAISLPLQEVYVELKAVADVPEAADTYSAAERRLLLEGDERGVEREQLVAELDTLRLERWRDEARRRDGSPSRFERRSIAEIVADLTNRGLVILGDPGSGKSTLLQYLALTYAQRSVGEELPIFVPFAAYDEYLRRQGNPLPLAQFLAIYYEHWRSIPGLQPLFEDALRQGRALVLLDGLDEVLENVTRRHVAEQTSAFIQQQRGTGNRFVVTSRVVGYREAKLPGDLPHVTVLDFGTAEIRQFAHQWCRVYEIWVAGRETPTALQRAVVEEADLLDDVTSNSSVAQLAANPLLLTMLALLRRQVGKLPDRRVELYEKYVRTLIDNRERERSEGARQHGPERFDPHQAIDHLIDLALWLQRNRPSGTARLRDIEEALVEICLRFDGYAQPHTAPAKARVQAEGTAARFFVDMRHFAGLLAERGRDAFGFLHLTFQEYFAGRALARMTPEERWRIVQPHLHQPRWREPILLCAAQLGVIDKRRGEADALAQQILEAASPHEQMLHRDLFLAGAVAADDVGLGQETIANLQAGLEPLISSPIPTVQEQAIRGLAHLARLGSRSASAALLAALGDSELRDAVMAHCTPLLRSPLGREVRGAILGKLDDGDNDVRSAAVGALGSLVGSDGEVRGAILGKLDDASWPVRIAALNSLLDSADADAEIAAILLPWLAMVSQSRFDLSQNRNSEDVLDDLVAFFSARAAEDEAVRAQIEAMLSARSAPARHRAARLLSSLPGGPPPTLLPRLRGLLADTRSEFRWPERLQVAELFINHRDSALDQQAIATALDALDYGHNPWYCYWSHESLYPPAIRKRAATILGRIDPLYPNPAVFARLAQVLVEDEDGDVRDAAYGALLRLAAVVASTPT